MMQAPQKQLPDVAPPVMDVYRVCYQHNGQPLDPHEEILPGIQGKFHTRHEAESSRQSCLRWFNYRKTCELVENKERFTVRERNVVDVWIEHYIDGALVTSDKPRHAAPAQVAVLEQPTGMIFSTMLHEILCKEFASTPEEAAETMYRHNDYIASRFVDGITLGNLRACAIALEEKDAEWRKENAPKQKEKEKEPTNPRRKPPMQGNQAEPVTEATPA